MIKKLLLPFLLLLALPFMVQAQSINNDYGDVNLDGEVNIADVNAVIDVILSDIANPDADVNLDGEINIADINAIIDIILGGKPETLCSTILVTTRDGVTVEHRIDQNTRVSIEKPNLVIETDGKVLTYDLEHMSCLRYGKRLASASPMLEGDVPLREEGISPDDDTRPQYALFTYRNDGGFNAFLNIDVDSITYSNTDLNGVAHGRAVVQQVWTPDSLYRIPLSAIDSIGFKAPATEYKPDVVIMDEQHMPYIVAATDSTITFNSTVPSSMVPVVGQIMYSDLTEDPFYMGFAGRVISIERSNGQVKYLCEPVSPDEVYDRHLDFFKVLTDTTEVIDDNSGPSGAPRRSWFYIADDGTIKIPEIKTKLDLNLNKLTDSKGNITCELSFENEFEYVICVGMLEHDFVNVKYTKKVKRTTTASLDLKFKKDTTTWMEQPVYSFGLKYLGVNIYPGLFMDASVAFSMEAKLPYTSSQIEEYYFGSDLGWSNPLVTTQESGGWPGSNEFLHGGNVKMKMNGSLAFGPTIKAAITVWKPSFLSFDVRAKAGLELSGECSIDMAETMDKGIDDTYDDVWSNIKLTTGLKIGLDLVGTAKKKEFKFLGASTTLFKQEKYLFPKFTTPALPQYQNGSWEASVTPTSMYTVPSQALLLPGKVGLGVYKQDGTFVRNFYCGNVYFGTEDYWPQNAVQCSLAGLEAGHEYVVRPLYRMLDFFEVKGGPRTVFCSPEPMSLEKPSLQLIKGTRSDVNILGGWGCYTVTSSNSKVTASIVSTYVSGVETFLVRVDAVTPGDATIKVKDVRTGDVVTLPVTVIDGQNLPLYVAEEALDFGVVPSGTTSTKTLTLINNTTSPKTVTATVDAPFSFAQGNSSVSSITVEVSAQSCSYVTVMFTASGQGASNGNITFVNDLFEGGKCEIPVQAYASSGNGRLYIEQQSLDLGEVPMGATRTGTLTIVNNSVSPQTVTAAINAPFSFSQDQSSMANLTVEVPGKSCSTVTVLYTATEAGTVNGNVTFMAEALEGGQCVIPVQATTPADGQSLYIEQQSLDLGDVPIGQTRTGELTIVNNTMAAKTLTATAEAPFWFKEGESCVSAKTFVVPGNSCGSVTIQFTATTPGDYSGDITFQNSALDGGLCVVSVHARAIADDTDYEWVDLGLPSGTLWATMNVGASSPEDYGDYFAWGETEPKDYYDWSTYKWCNGSESTMTKYCSDNKTELEPEDDAAHVNWGPSWRMPTTEQYKELVENCTWTWRTRNGVDGRLVTGPNGNTIFLPAAGRRWSGNLYDAGYWSYYWSRTLFSGHSSKACSLYFHSNAVYWYDYYLRGYGFAVRAVRVAPADGQSLYIEQQSLDLGEVPIGQTRTGELTIVNNTMAAKTLTATADAPFWFKEGESCVSAKTFVVPGNSCGSVTIQFTATTPGDYSGNVTFQNSALDGGQCVVLVHARAVTDVEPQTETFTVNGVTFKMVAVEGGTFMMGATEEQGSDADSDEYPAHQVTLSSFAIGQTEVTQALWVAVMGSNPSSFIGELACPVENVSWDDCQTFIIKLNEITGKHFRLPTEAEWEFAARGGNLSKGYKYAGSNDIGEVAWYNGNASRKTHPIATKNPNELGLYDMTGNVWEWMQDWYASYSGDAQTNPIGPVSGSSRLNRGGGWKDVVKSCRVSNRGDNPPSTRYNLIGLRLAMGGMPEPEGQHEWVDLGLPSGTLWATCNVGANAPEEYGDYFAWGETEPKDCYNWSTYKWCNGDLWTLTKYCINSNQGYNGFTDGKTELEPEDDAAYVNWGPQWRMPTKEQQDELWTNCTWTWTTRNGVNGRLVTGPSCSAARVAGVAVGRARSTRVTPTTPAACTSVRMTLAGTTPIAASGSPSVLCVCSRI